MIWDCFEHAYLINLDHRTDRLARMRARLDKLDIPFERVPAIRSFGGAGYEKPGELGLVQTHIKILKHALAQGWARILIIEDDAVFRDDCRELFQTMLPGLKTQYWDLLFLGAAIGGMSWYIGENLVHPTHICQSQVLGINKFVMKRLLDDLQNSKGNPVDLFYGRTSVYSVVASWPMLAVQEPGHSDITNGYTQSCTRAWWWRVFKEHCSDPAIKELE